MKFFSWPRRENTEDKVLLELKDRRIEALKECISTMEERMAALGGSISALRESVDVQRLHIRLLEGRTTPEKQRISKDLN